MKIMVNSLFVIALALLATSAMGAASVEISREQFTDTGTIFNSCTSEEIRYEALTFFTVRTTTSESGHVSMTLNLHGISKGVGLTSGAQYIGAGQFVHYVDSYDSTVFPPHPAVFNVTFRGTLVGQGGLPNSSYRFFDRLTVNANGEVTHNDPGVFIEGCK